MNSKPVKTYAALLALALLTLSPGCKRDKYSLHYSHNLHVVENEIECATCHEAGPAGAMQLPDHTACLSCHEIEEDKPSAECLLCHKVSSPEQIEVRHAKRAHKEEIVFSHEKHKYMDAACADCHTGAARSTSSRQNVLPPKEACIVCHDDETAPQKDCGVCHVATSPVNATHKLDWEERHGLESKFGGANCLTCHREDTCIACHQDTKPRDHNNTWRKLTHGAEAAWNRSRCMTCHQEDSCDRCHSSTRPRSHRGAWNRGERPQHCSQCHIPVGPGTCSVCHKQADHPSAVSSPHPPFVGFDCSFCHPTGPGDAPHPFPAAGIACTVCHQR